MADYFTKACFELPFTPQEQLLIEAALEWWEDDPVPSILEPYFASRDVFEDGFGATIEGNTIHDTLDFNPDNVALLIQKVAPSVLPCSFLFIFDCTKSRTDAYGGGVMRVSSKEISCVLLSDFQRPDGVAFHRGTGTIISLDECEITNYDNPEVEELINE